MLEMICPFCRKKVGDENSALHGCRECIEKWLREQNVDHQTG